MQNKVKRGRPRKTVINNPTKTVVVKKVKMDDMEFNKNIARCSC